MATAAISERAPIVPDKQDIKAEHENSKQTEAAPSAGTRHVCSEFDQRN
jgi:hypothetical protein